MRKGYVIADFLTEKNKADMNAAAAETGFELEFFDDAEQASGHVADGEILYAGYDAITVTQMPNIKWCHTAFAGIGAYAGTGAFDSGEAVLTFSSGAYGRTIAEHIIMVSLMLMRKMYEYNKIMNAREWTRVIPIRSIIGSNIVIMGTGDIGSTAAARFKGLGANKVIGLNRSGRQVSEFDETYKLEEFDRLFADKDFASSVDILVLALPGTPESAKALSRERIGMLSEKTYVVNVGRGSTIDQDALLEALNEEKIAGASLDVVEPEPLPADHPLWSAKNTIITPHISGNMGLQYTVDKTVEFFCENLRRYAAGEPLTHQADIKKGY